MLEDKIVKFDITDEDLEWAVSKALKVDFIDNLRARATFVKLDSKIRGYLGEIGMSRFLTTNGITILGTDQYQSQDYEDKDILISNNYREITLEVKTSLVPDNWGTLEEVLQKADIKIIKRETDYHNIKADFHLQIYFNQYTNRRDTYLKSISGSPHDYSVSEIIEIMRLKTLRQVFVAWISKADLFSFLDSQMVKTWKCKNRYFWRCPLSLSKEPNLLIDAIKAYR